jgi:hypothetical protein
MSTNFESISSISSESISSGFTNSESMSSNSGSISLTNVNIQSCFNQNKIDNHALIYNECIFIEYKKI